MSQAAFTPPPEAAAPVLDLPPSKPQKTLMERMEKYQTKCVGRDMMLKSIVYTLRLATLHCGNNQKLLTKLQVLILNIIDTRMLFNQIKYINSARMTIKTLMAKDSKPTTTVIKVFTALSWFFRTFEQFFGDLGYVQKNWLTTEWSRQRLSWHYKFNKSISLTLNAIVELIKVLVLQGKISRANEAKRGANHRRVNSGAMDSFISSPSSSGPNLDRNHVSSPAAQEATPSGNQVSHFPNSPGTDPIPSPEKSPAQPSLKPQNVNHDVADLTHQRNRCTLFFLRNIADMIIYFQWVTWYQPNLRLCYLCGVFSGLVGVHLVWEDS